MGSAQEPGIVTFWRVDKTGSRQYIYSADVSILGPGGSQDGAKATTANADNQLFLPPTGPWLERDDTLLITFKSVATDGIDVSDCFVMIPITTKGGVKYIVETDLTNPDPGDYTSTATVESVHGGWQANEPCRLGGGHIFLSIEDDT